MMAAVKRVTLSTPRLVVRDLPPSAAGRVARFHAENWQFHQPWEPHRRHEYFTPGVQRRILRAERRSESMLHLWLLLRSGEGPRTWRRLGYKMDARYGRRGHMKEALGRVMDYAFGELQLHRLEANVMPRNTASLALLRSLGFFEEGLAPAYLQIQGVWEDHLHMVMLREQWQRGEVTGRVCEAGAAVSHGGRPTKSVSRP
jgi:ribosomal-protein-alanine N-acetyltransferase